MSKRNLDHFHTSCKGRYAPAPSVRNHTTFPMHRVLALSPLHHLHCYVTITSDNTITLASLSVCEFILAATHGLFCRMPANQHVILRSVIGDWSDKYKEENNTELCSEHGCMSMLRQYTIKNLRLGRFMRLGEEPHTNIVSPESYKPLKPLHVFTVERGSLDNLLLRWPDRSCPREYMWCAYMTPNGRERLCALSRVVRLFFKA